MSKKQLPPLETTEMEEGTFKKFSRRRLLTWSLLSVAGFLGIRAIANSEDERGLPWPLRKITDLNDGFWKANFKSDRLAKKTSPTDKPLRLNGDIGMNSQVSSNWHLTVTDPEMEEPLSLSLAEIKKLPAVTESFEFKCIEGWSQHTTCTGVRFSDFMKSYNAGIKVSGKTFSYAQLSSINGEYYVSMDTKSLLHPQTLLCYEMNGKELSMKNGYPLRLVTPVKYGVKNIKQLGSIAFSESPPADYWAERGYGDYLGL